MDNQRPKFYLTTAIDYPNSRPHIGTAFEKIGADVQARYRRMEGYDVHFVMGNDENTIKVARRAAELGMDVKAYCDDMARQFREVWDALDISYDEFVQTSEPRHHRCATAFAQKVYENGYLYKGVYEGWYCEGCEAFKTESDIKEGGGLCPNHKTPPVRRTEPTWFFAQSRFQERLLKLYEDRPDFIQPESRRNEMLSYVQGGLQDVSITRIGQSWGIRLPFDPEFTIWVWFDALLTYLTGIGYATDDARFERWWPADIHFIGKDITRFHCALWPAMLLAAGLEPPRMVFSHGFVYNKGGKISKSLGNVVEPMDVISKFNSEAFRYYFLRECPFPGDGDFTWERFTDLYNADLANNLGNLYSRVVTLILRNFSGELADTRHLEPGEIYKDVDVEETTRKVQDHIESCQYNQALQTVWAQILDPANQYAEKTQPWSLVKTDKEAAKRVLFDLVECLRVAAILLKPFLPRTSETIYRSFNFAQSYEDVRCEDVYVYPRPVADLKLTAKLDASGKVPPLFPRIA
ncbi:MAG: methionine--tRNA ligase [Gemmatales bacterium]|nr:methionine--tRNA ligase [Gemmatales bacterium]MDW8387117.1 methionine--tRNA ligase [Gemmatales bacterium]